MANEVSLIIRAKDFASRVLSSTEGTLKKLGISARGLATAFAAVAATATGIGFLGKKLFDVGATVFETRSKFEAVFGTFSKQVNEASSALGRLAGLSRSATQEVLATTGAMVQGMGFGRDASASLSLQVLQLAADLTSFNNVPIADTSRAIQAAITGEREQLKRLGIVVREADVQQRAMAMSGKTNADALTQQEKAAATLAIITERAGVAIGDLARTQDSAANRARQLSADLKNITEDLAVRLLPTLLEFIPVIQGIAQAAAEGVPKLAAFVGTLAQLVGLANPTALAETAAIMRLDQAGLGVRKGLLEGSISRTSAQITGLTGARRPGERFAEFEQRQFQRAALEEELAGLDAALDLVNKRLKEFEVATAAAAGASAAVARAAAGRAGLAGLSPHGIMRMDQRGLQVQKGVLEGSISRTSARMTEIEGTRPEAMTDALLGELADLQEEIIGLDTLLDLVNNRLKEFEVATAAAAGASAAVARAAAGRAGLAGLSPQVADITSRFGTIGAAVAPERVKGERGLMVSRLPAELTAAQGEVADRAAESTKFMTDRIAEFATGIRKTAEATELSTTLMVTAAGQLIQGIINATRGGGAGGFLSGLFGAAGLIGTIFKASNPLIAGLTVGGGIVSTLIGGGRSREPVPVRDDAVFRQLQQQEQRDRIISITIVDPSGRTIDTIRYDLDRQTRRDAVPRLP